MPARKVRSVSIVFPDRWRLSFNLHLIAPLINFGARVAPGFHYRRNVDDVITNTIAPLIAAGTCIKRLRIHSHGYVLRDAGGAIAGSRISAGSDTIRWDHFDSDGALIAGTPTEALLLALDPVMCHPGVIVFDACDQGASDLLKNISLFLGPDRTVRGHRRLGVPWGRGNLSYTNGEPG